MNRAKKAGWLRAAIMAVFFLVHLCLDTWAPAVAQDKKTAANDDLTASGPPDVLALPRLVGQLKTRDAMAREAALRRLLPYPGLAAGPVVEAFVHGSLQTRLSTLEILRAWKAPVADLDPWRPETLQASRLKALQDWTAHAAGEKHEARESTPAELATIRAEIARMLQAPEAEAIAARERLARYGRALLPEVYAELKHQAADLPRERLTALRYRLVASDALALSWPGGLERLAATAAGPRQQAVQELVAHATPADEALLLELFSNPDPLVRELSLRALQDVVGPAATPALARLLTDPEPNVRAAVLKQLTEKPSKGLVKTLVQYARGEKDAALVVHAVRALRAAGGPQTIDVLKDLLKHESWQVRAEAADALANAIDIYHQQAQETQERNADICVALTRLLDDPDGFVVSRAIPALSRLGLVSSVEPLLQAARKHPELAPEIVRKLSSPGQMSIKALPHLREFCKHPDPEVRAAAIIGLEEMALHGSASRHGVGDAADFASPAQMQPELRAALEDPAGRVRQAGGEAVFAFLDGAWTDALFSSRQAKSEELEPWLVKFQLDKNRPGWLAALVPQLEHNLHAGTGEEKLAAAMPLIALGRGDEALPVLLEAVKSQPELQHKASVILHWLPWEKRLVAFNRLLTESGPEQLEILVRHFTDVRDKRAIPRLWDLAATGDNLDVAPTLLYGLERLYFGPAIDQRNNGILAVAAADQKSAAADALPRAEHGPPLRRLVALGLLLPALPDDAGEVLRKVMNDPRAGPSLRRDAFQMLLGSQPAAGRRRSAIDALNDADPGIREVALAFLANAFRYSAPSLELKLNVHRYNESHVSMVGVTSGVPIVLEPPADLKPEQLRPLLRDPNANIAGLAGYLLALLHDPAGLDALIRAWRAQPAEHDTWAPLVYGAVATLHDDNKVPLLEEIYRNYIRNELIYQVPQLYWTIRVMDGPRALRLRKQMRSELGAAALH
jgi:HEAT repeat protein